MTRTGTVRCAEFVVLGKSPARHQKIGSDPRSRSYAFYFFLFFDFAGAISRCSVEDGWVGGVWTVRFCVF